MSVCKNLLRMCLLIVPGFVSAQDVTPPMLDVTTVDGYTMTIPGSMMGNVFGGHLTRSPSRSPDDNNQYTTDLNKQQVCQDMRSNPPKDENGNTCTTSTFPASPNIKSASGSTWAGNGCGAGPWTTAFGSGALKGKYGDDYSGDVNKPVASNPSIDFTSICNAHDSCYTSSPVGGKAGCDNRFASTLNSYCVHSTSPGDCADFASDYENAVSNYGADAWTDDQAQLACSRWGSAMKSDGC